MRQDMDTQLMRRPLAGSLLLHVLVVALIGVGLPSLREPPPPEEDPIVVDLVPVAARSNPPPAAETAPRAEPAAPSSPPQPRPRETKPPEQAEPKPAARREPPPPAQRKPEPKAEPSPPAKPEARAETRAAPASQPPPKVAARAPEPEAKREPLPKTEPRPAQKPERPQAAPVAAKPEPVRKPEAQKPERPQAAPAAAKPEPVRKPETRKPESQKPENQKPEPAQDFAAVQKTVSELKQRDGQDAGTGKPAPAAEAKPARPDADSGFTSQVAQALRSTAPPGNAASLPVTSSEIDAVRRQIERCWNMPAGAKDAAGLVIALRVEMNMDGTPRSATLDTASKGQGSAYFQAAADSARRAVLNPRCHPFKLPPDKFDRWRTITLIFNPREMAGT